MRPSISTIHIFAKKKYMPETSQAFSQAAASKAFDKDHRQKINFNISRYAKTVVKGKKQYSNLELARQKAKNVKWKAISNLDKYLVEFEANFTANGGKVIWARDADEAIAEILKIVHLKKAKTVVKSKSMATEEIELNLHLEHEGLEVFETDLGEYIQQMDGEKPYHIVTPAMHKSKEDVADLFHRKLGCPENSTPRELTMIARKELRQKYIDADIGFSGANFLIADTGSIAITENEGNVRMTTAFPKTHIAIVGIEKMIPSVKDLALFWPLLATFGTGQNVTVYNSIFSGPKQEDEVNGPEEMYVVLLDNGRSNLLAQVDQREALYCIRCGACLNACPVYKNIGGHTYNTTYSGPIGSIISPHLRGMKDFKHLSHASSLCGNCTEVCPVRIDLHNLLLYNRRDTVKAKMNTRTERLMFYAWKKGVLNRSLMNRGTAGIKNGVMKLFFKNSWGKRKALPTFPNKSFNQRWTERYG